MTAGHPFLERNPLRRLLIIQPGPPRLAFALRAALCMAAPVVVGWVCGDIGAGLIATLGAFTALYGANRPYLYRAGYLAAIAICFAVFVTFGDWAAQRPWTGVLAICAVAVLATFVCNALSVGPPGAYMFMLACAAGTGLETAHLSRWHVGLLVLGGGAFAWVVHMIGAVAGYRRPERGSVAAARRAVEGYVAAMGSDAELSARHRAARALHDCWQMLVNFQPPRAVPPPRLRALRGEALLLHFQFADAMNGATTTSTPDPDSVPLGRPRTVDLLRRSAARGSPVGRIAIRVGVAAVIAGFVALWLGVDHAYWAVAAAVLMLHQGFDWVRTVTRGLERVVGTFVGLAVAGAVLAANPHGLVLAVLLAALQFGVEMLVVRSYALAVVLITPLALTIAFGGRPVDDVAALLMARGVDTLIGCLAALLVYGLASRGHDVARLADTATATLGDIGATVPFVAGGTVRSAAALAARRDLQLSLLAMVAAYDNGVGGSVRERDAAERLWPTVMATENLGYRVLAACWSVEHGDGAPPELFAQQIAEERQRLQEELVRQPD